MKPVKSNWIFIFFMLLCLSTVACSEVVKKEGKVVVVEQEFTIRQDSEFAYVVDGKGTIKNIGEIDVKRIVVTGNCLSCGTTLTAGAWMNSPDVDKTPQQMDIISYLKPGGEESFSFRGVAYMYNKTPEMPKKLPETLEIEIVSFESVENP